MIFDFKDLRFSGGGKYTQEIILPMITLSLITKCQTV